VGRRDLRGFTLTEVMVVVFMIAVLAAVASPSFVKVMRDTSLSRMNMHIAEVYRKAYVESAEQATYLVRWTGGTAPTIELVKATLDSQFPSLVSPKYASLGYLTNANEEKTKADVCYSQRRAFVRYDDGAFVDMPGAGRIYVKNLQTNVMRRVLIPSFGLPRLIQ
jgi:prepilin-type N-terminal cleavage/methylation domain-containing protein